MTFKNSRFLFKPSASIIAFLLMLNSIYAFAETLAYPHVYLGEPSESKEKGKAEKMTVKYMCVGEHTGVSYSCDLQSELIGIRDSAGIDRFKINNLVSGIPSFDCPNTSGLDVENLYIYGGHLENQNSRAYTYGTSDYSLNVPDENGGRYIVKGKTRTDVATELVYETPKMAGIYTALTSLTLSLIHI